MGFEGLCFEEIGFHYGLGLGTTVVDRQIASMLVLQLLPIHSPDSHKHSFFQGPLSLP